MKSYTDVPQSKILAEFLPIDTADCCYIKYCTSDNIEWRYEGQPPMFLGDIPITEIDAEYIPCWSLVALLDAFSKEEKVSVNVSFGFYNSEGNYIKSYICCYEREAECIDDYIIRTTTANNLIDACVEMILKLHKDGLL